MPYVRCPVCRHLYHLQVREMSFDDWARGHVRERDADGTPLLECFRCWVPLKPGHRVTLRSVPEALSRDLAAGDAGIVESAGDDVDGEITVRFGATLAALERTDLFYVP